MRLDSNGIALNLMKCVFSKDSVQWLFSKDGNKPDRSELAEIEEAYTPKNAKNLRNLFGFPNFAKQFIPNYRTLKYTHASLNRTLTKESRF